MNLDLLNPKSTGLDRVTRTTILRQVSSHSDQVFSFYHANIRPHRGPTHTSWQNADCYSRITSSA